MITRRSLLRLATLTSAALALPIRLLGMNEPAEDERIDPPEETTSDESEDVKWIGMSVSVGKNEQFYFAGCNAIYLQQNPRSLLILNQKKESPYYEHICRVANPRKDGKVYFEFAANGKLLASVGTSAKYVAQRRFDIIERCLEHGVRISADRIQHPEKYHGGLYIVDHQGNPVPATPSRKYVAHEIAIDC